jgi:hypothetical protein
MSHCIACPCSMMTRIQRLSRSSCPQRFYSCHTLFVPQVFLFVPQNCCIYAQLPPRRIVRFVFWQAGGNILSGFQLQMLAHLFASSRSILPRRNENRMRRQNSPSFAKAGKKQLGEEAENFSRMVLRRKSYSLQVARAAMIWAISVTRGTKLAPLETTASATLIASSGRSTHPE